MLGVPERGRGEKKVSSWWWCGKKKRDFIGGKTHSHIYLSAQDAISSKARPPNGSETGGVHEERTKVTHSLNSAKEKKEKKIMFFFF